MRIPVNNAAARGTTARPFGVPTTPGSLTSRLLSDPRWSSISKIPFRHPVIGFGSRKVARAACWQRTMVSDRLGPECAIAIEDGFHNNWRSATPSNPGPSSESSQTNGRRLRRPGIWAPGATSSPVAPPSARGPRDSPSEEPAAGTRPVQRGKGVVRFSKGVEIQFGDPNARRGAPQVDITS